MHLLYQPAEAQLAREEQPPKFDAAKFDAAIDWVYRQRRYTASMLAEEPGLELLRETANLLTEAFDQGIASGVIPPEMDAKLRESVFLFSACKTHHELAEVASMLRTEKGGIKPFGQFARQVKAIHNDYNVNYLNAEYKFAISSAQMSAKWAEVERDGDDYDLQYRTADDTKVRQAHQLLHNKTLPPSDPFWDQYYPPNGWGCRCDAVQVRKMKYERSDPAQAAKDGYEATRQVSGNVDKGAIFRFNPGKSRQLFPPKHPYYKLSGEDKTQIKRVVANMVADKRTIDLDQIASNKTITEADLKNIMAVYAEKHSENYNGGLLDVVVKRNGNAFMSNGRYSHKQGNVLTIHNHNFTIDGVRFNPALEAKGALQAIRIGKQLSFAQEYAMESLWHETLHAKAKGWSDRKLRNDQTIIQMETINQFVARHTYPTFIEQLGGKASNQNQVLEQGYGYQTPVGNFRALLKHHKIKESELVDAISDKLFNEPYENVGASTIEFLKSKGVENAETYMNSLKKKTEDYVKLFNPNQ